MTLFTFGMIYLACLAVLLAVVFQDAIAKGGQEAGGEPAPQPSRGSSGAERPQATHQGGAPLVFSTHH